MTSAFENLTVPSFTTPNPGDPRNAPSVAGSVDQLQQEVAAMAGALLGGGIYSPTPNGNGLSNVSSTWAGAYQRIGFQGELWLAGAVTGNWAGSGFLSIPLPATWQAAGIENEGVAWGNPMPTLGVHWTGVAVVHPNELEVHFIQRKKVTAIGLGPGVCAATASTDQINCIAAHGLAVGEAVTVMAADHTAFPAGLTIAATYYVTDKNNDGTAWTHTSTTFKLSTTFSGNAINITSDALLQVHRQVDTVGNQELPLNGVDVPATGAFTGDGTTGNQDRIYAHLKVFLTDPV